MTPVANLPPVSMTLVANCRWYQRHRRQICHRYQRHRWQILPPVPLVANLPPVSMIPAANLPPVSTPPVTNNGNNIRLQTPYSELEGKNLYIYDNSTTQRCPNKIIKNFLLEDFFCLPPVSLTPVVHLEPRISPRFFEKFEMAVMVYSDAWGKLIHEKNQKSKISWHCPFKFHNWLYKVHALWYREE